MPHSDPLTSLPTYAALSQGTRRAIAADHEQMSRWAADLIHAELEHNPRLLLGCATGSTPTLTYAQLVASLSPKPQLARELRVLQIDEWGGLPAGDRATCEAYLRQRLLKPLAIPAERYL